MWMPVSGTPGEFIGIGGRSFRSTRCTTTPATARTIAGIRFKAVRSIRTTLDADHRQNDDCRRFGISVDIFAARAHLVGKSDDLAHCKFPLPRSCASSRPTVRRLLQLKDLQG